MKRTRGVHVHGDADGPRIICSLAGIGIAGKRLDTSTTTYSGRAVGNGHIGHACPGD